MERLAVGGKNLEAVSVYKIDQTKSARAIANAAFDDGADNVFFGIGKDVFVASGKAMDLDGVKSGSPVAFKGQTGEVGAVATAAGIGIGALCGSRRKANFEAFKQFAE